jgi:hypothetical protein
MIANSEALRAAQEKIGRRIFELLGLTFAGHHDASVVPGLPNRKMNSVAVGRQRSLTRCCRV